MKKPDWKDVDDYCFTGTLRPEQWAWEFLRRNPDYCREWRSFHAIWEALEAEYGKPPQRDFCAWKADPRAWLPASECASGDCRVDGDKVLIECALGARWGFYKFPPDPADDDPVGDGRLVWRELAEEALPVVTESDVDWLGREPALLALGFDLSLPLKGQLQKAKRYLQMEQHQRRKSGQLVPQSVASNRQRWTTYLRLLDAGSDGANDQEQQSLLDGDRLSEVRAAAWEMVNGGYRRIPLLPG